MRLGLKTVRGNPISDIWVAKGQPGRDLIQFFIYLAEVQGEDISDALMAVARGMLSAPPDVIMGAIMLINLNADALPGNGAEILKNAIFEINQMFPKISSMDSAEKNKWLTIVRAFYGQVGGIINEEDEEAFVESDINHIMANNQLLIREIIIDSRPGFDETTDLSVSCTIHKNGWIETMVRMKMMMMNYQWLIRMGNLMKHYFFIKY